MGWFSDFVNNPLKSLQKTGQDIITTVNTVADNIIRDPVPIIASAVGAEFGIPVYVSAAAVVASRGGNVEDMAKAAALSAATADILKTTPVVDITSQIGSYVGSATTASVGNAVTSGLNTSVVAGIRAAITGKPISEAIAAGFATGAIGSGVSSTLSSLNKDLNWGLSKEVLTKISGVTSAGITGVVTGKDPSALIGNYIANAMLNAGKSELKQSLAETQKVYDQKIADTTAAQREYAKAVSEAQTMQDLNSQTITNYNSFELPLINKAYDLYQKGNYADAMSTLGVQNKSATAYNASITLNDYIKTQTADVNKAVSYLEAPSEDNKFIQVADAKYQDYLKTVNDLKPVQENLTNLVTRFDQNIASDASTQFLMDAIKSGQIKSVVNPDGEKNAQYFEGGIEIKDGAIYQNGQKLYTTAEPQTVTQLLSDLGIDNKSEIPVTQVGATMVKGIFRFDENGQYAEYVPDGKGGFIPTNKVDIIANRNPKEGEETGREYMVDYDSKDVASTLEPVTLPPIESDKVKPVSTVDNPDGTFTQTMSDGTTRIVDGAGNPVEVPKVPEVIPTTPVTPPGAPDLTTTAEEFYKSIGIDPTTFKPVGGQTVNPLETLDPYATITDMPLLEGVDPYASITDMPLLEGTGNVAPLDGTSGGNSSSVTSYKPTPTLSQIMSNPTVLAGAAAGLGALANRSTSAPVDTTGGQRQVVNWNMAPWEAPINGVATGQAHLNPKYQTVPAAQGGLMSLAHGGAADLGGYSDGGRLLKGPGDGMSDNIPATISNKQPARLADGEFVIPADVVSHLGNGSTEAGANVLYKMMEQVRKARTGNSKQGKQINPNKFVPK